MVTKEQLNKYYSEHLDDLVEWADDIDKVCPVCAYLDEDDNLYSGINQLSYTQLRVPIQAEVVVDNDSEQRFLQQSIRL